MGAERRRERAGCGVAGFWRREERAEAGRSRRAPESPWVESRRALRARAPRVAGRSSAHECRARARPYPKISLTFSKRFFSSSSASRGHRLELFLRKRPAQLFERGSLFLVELLRRHRLHGKERDRRGLCRTHPACPCSASRKTLPDCVPSGTLNDSVSVERRHVDAAAKRQRREVQRNLAREVVAFAAEERVRRDFDEDVEIARRSALRSRPRPHR